MKSKPSEVKRITTLVFSVFSLVSLSFSCTPTPVILMVSSTLKPPDPTSDSITSDLHQPSEDLSYPSHPSPALSVSFREAVANSSEWFVEAKNSFQSSSNWDDPLPIAPDAPNVVNFSKDELAALRQPWQLTLMGKCLEINIRPSFMAQRIKIMWRPKGQVEKIDIGHNTFLFRFSMKDDFERALFGGPWFILDHYLMLTTWKPNFRPSMNPFSKMIVWIRFPELPVEYFNKLALFSIAKVAGRPIRVDYATDQMSKGRYARVCVEINLGDQLVSKVWVGGAWQQVQYENLHTLCFSCGRVGHSKESCTSIEHLSIPEPSSVLVGSLSPINVPSGPSSSQRGAGPPSSSNPTIGPWIMVSNKRSGRKSLDFNKSKSSPIPDPKRSSLKNKSTSALILKSSPNPALPKNVPSASKVYPPQNYNHFADLTLRLLLLL